MAIIAHLSITASCCKEAHTVGGVCRAVLLNVNEPESRGFALGLMTVLDDIGKGAGPSLVSILITVLKRWG